MLWHSGAVRIATVTHAILTDAFRGFPQSIQANTGIVPSSGNDRFRSKPIELIHLCGEATDSVVK
jgi:hypothetical protein